jgi:epoxide hydrolase-like predicted phosphatase
VAIEAVVFDIGDVLEENPRTGWPERWATRLSTPVAQFERRLGEIWAPGSVGRLSLDDIERQTAAAFDLDDTALAALMEDAWREYVGTLNHELADYFARLRPRYKTGILSNSFVGAREREQQAHRLDEICDVIVYSHEEGCLKPDPQIYRIACDRLGVDPESAVLLDDLEANVEGARAVGMNAITFRTNAQAISELQALLGVHVR